MTPRLRALLQNRRAVAADDASAKTALLERQAERAADEAGAMMVIWRMGMEL